MKPHTPVASEPFGGLVRGVEPGWYARVPALVLSRIRLSPSLRSLPLALLVWLPSALLVIYVKWTCLVATGFSAALGSGAVVGRAFPVGGSSLPSVLCVLRSLQADLVLAFGIVPILWLAFLFLFGARWGLRVVVALSLLAAFALCIELQVLHTSSRFLAFEMAREAFEWAVAHRFQFLQYLQPGSLLLLAGLGSVSVWTLIRLRRAAPRVLRGFQWFSVMLYGAMIVVALFSAALGNPVPTHLHRSVLELSWKQWLDRPLFGIHSGMNAAAASRVPVETRPPPPTIDFPVSVGRAEGYDVIIWSLETAPARCFNLRELPALRGLAADSWISTRHFTTFPNTTHAHYSMLTGCYPPRDVLSVERPRVNALPRLLRSRGYSTGIYGGENFDAANSRTYRALGLDIHGAGLGDRESLDLMLGDIDAHLVRNERYFAMFCPQIGHGPWEDPGTPMTSPLDRRRAILQTEDAWISRLVDVLKARGRLDKTLLIVTGDHGVRDPAEDPAFKPGRVDEYSFRVPLIFHAPGVARGRLLQQVTSHIDLAPTLLGLLGVTAPPSSMSGLGLWDEGIAIRRTYFLGRSYLGADGYHDGVTGSFFMWNELHDLVLKSSSMRFEPATDVVPEEFAGLSRAVFRHMNESTGR